MRSDGIISPTSKSRPISGNVIQVVQVSQPRLMFPHRPIRHGRRRPRREHACASRIPGAGVSGTYQVDGRLSLIDEDQGCDHETYDNRTRNSIRPFQHIRTRAKQRLGRHRLGGWKLYGGQPGGKWNQHRIVDERNHDREHGRFDDQWSGHHEPEQHPEPVRQYARSQRIAQRVDVGTHGPRIRHGQVNEKKPRESGAFFDDAFYAQRDRDAGYLPLVSTFCFSSSFIFLTVGSGFASPVVCVVVAGGLALGVEV